MTNPYLLLYIDEALTGPNKSIWSSPKGLEVETMSLVLKDDLTIFPFWHAPQGAYEWQSMSGKPLTSCNLLSLEINLQLACHNLLCHNHCISFTHIKQTTFWSTNSEKLILKTLFFPFPLNTMDLSFVLIIVWWVNN